MKLRDRKRKGYRSGPPGGAKHPNAKLTEHDVALMRGLYWVEVMSIRLIAQKFELSTSTTWAVVTGDLWPHVAMPDPRSVNRL